MGELHAGGWNRVGWPAEAGGLGGDVRHRAVLYDEMVAAGLAIPLPSLVLEVLGPTLVRFGSHFPRRQPPWSERRARGLRSSDLLTRASAAPAAEQAGAARACLEMAVAYAGGREQPRAGSR